MALNIVLIEPEIPNNTGNIGRLCLALGAKLHLVKPFGFELSNSRLKRAGLDYWQHIDLTIYKSQDEFFQQHQDEELVFLSSHASKPHWEIPFIDNLFLVFGKESVGLPKDLISANPESTYKIPLDSSKIRSINLANAVAVVGFEGVRQLQC